MTYTVTLPSGVEWTPQFAEEISEEKCIGCGRCFKVCGRNVLQLVGIDEDGERVAVTATSQAPPPSCTPHPAANMQ